MSESKPYLALVRGIIGQRAAEPAPEAVGAAHGDRGGRREFVDYLFEKYRSPLLRYITTLLSSRHDAEDILQETYIRIIGSSNVDCLEVRARSYLYTIATNLVRDRIRHEKVRANAERMALEEAERGTGSPRPDQTLQWNEGLQIVRRCLAELEPRCRRVFLLSLVENLTYREIAQVLDVSTKTVERDMQLAVQLCQTRLKDWQ